MLRSTGAGRYRAGGDNTCSSIAGVTQAGRPASRSTTPTELSLITMFDVDLLIQCVQGKPALWEKSAPEYSDKNLKEKSWYEIGEGDVVSHVEKVT